MPELTATSFLSGAGEVVPEGLHDEGLMRRRSGLLPVQRVRHVSRPHPNPGHHQHAHPDQTGTAGLDQADARRRRSPATRPLMGWRHSPRPRWEGRNVNADDGSLRTDRQRKTETGLGSLDFAKLNEMSDVRFSLNWAASTVTLMAMLTLFFEVWKNRRRVG